MKNAFGKKLLDWYEQNKRNLPWRNVDDPYKIWISEIILQQTRVGQGMAYYQKFIASFPDVYSLAKASSQEVYKLWQGLGYYNRAENLMKTARYIATNFKGKFPQDLETLKTLPGIGDYTAAAIASLAFHKPHAVVDGNVYRVLSRIFGIETPIHTAKGKKEFAALARELLNGNPPAAFNQALMEFGALFCVPQNPPCETCPFRAFCAARMSDRVTCFPVKAKKAATGHRYYYYFVLQEKHNGNLFFYIKKRSGRDIWRNLYDFPALETSRPLPDPLDSLSHLQNILPEGSPSFSAGSPSEPYNQLLSHLKVSARFIPVFLQKPLPVKAKNFLSLVQKNQLSTYPVPRLIARYLQDYNLTK